MPRRVEAPGFGERVARMRTRLGFETRNEFARRVGLPPGTFLQWETKDSAPAMSTLKRVVKSLGVSGWKDLLSWWLADGEDAPPAWLDDPTLDPFAAAASSPEPTPTGPGGLRPGAVAAEVKVRGSAARALDEAEHELRDRLLDRREDEPDREPDADPDDPASRGHGS